MTPNQKRLLKAWAPSAFWMGLIALESSATFSANNTSRILYPIFHFLFGVSRERFVVWHFYIRKSGHFVGYFTMSFLLFNSWRATVPVPSASRWALRWAWIAWLMTAFIATLDEWHQSFIPSRTGSVRDVILDSSAALTAQIFLWLIWRAGSMRP